MADDVSQKLDILIKLQAAALTAQMASTLDVFADLKSELMRVRVRLPTAKLRRFVRS